MREVKLTGAEAKAPKTKINTEWIHPPNADRAQQDGGHFVWKRAYKGAEGAAILQKMLQFKQVIFLMENIMTFNEIVQEFEHSRYGSGTDAFLTVKNAMRELITSDPRHAVVYFLVHNFARTYVILHDDEAILQADANEAKGQLLDYMTRLNIALSQGSDKVFTTASEIVTEYMRSKRPF